MSLINQVLNDLEKRGAGAPPGESSIRPVSVQGKQRKVVLPLTIVLALLLAAGLWWGNLQRKSTAPASVAPINPLQAPAQQLAEPQAASQPVAASAQEAPQQDGMQETGAPASRLSFELSSIPLPSSLRAKPVQTKTLAISGGNQNQTAVAGQSHNKTAPPSENKIPVAVAVAVSAPVAPPDSADKQIKQISVRQQADNEFRKASGLMQQGRSNDALAGYEAALQLDAGHDAARQAMVGLLLESKRNADAERVLQDGLEHNPKHSGFAMLLARLQVERNELKPALELLQKTLPYAERQADYQAFVAALLQRQGQHKEAVTHYQAALQLTPGSGIWLMGLGISLQALQRNEEARDAFQRAIASHSLNAELQAFVTQRLKDL